MKEVEKGGFLKESVVHFLNGYKSAIESLESLTSSQVSIICDANIGKDSQMAVWPNSKKGRASWFPP